MARPAVDIPPGKFLMGSPKDEKGRFDDEEQGNIADRRIRCGAGF